MATRRFTRGGLAGGGGAAKCPSCRTATSLWAEQHGVCDVCAEAGAFFASYESEEYETEAEAKRQFFASARAQWPSLDDDRLEACWGWSY